MKMRIRNAVPSILIIIISALTSLSLPLAAQQAADKRQSKPEAGAAAQPEKNPLQAIAWLTGGTWRAEAKPPQATEKPTSIASTIEWSPNKAAIQFITRFNGDAHYNGFYAWDGQKKSITFYYNSSEGELTIGTVLPDADGKGLTQEFDIIKPDGTVNHLKSRIDRDGDDAYNWNVMGNRNGQWVELIRLHYTRTRP